MSDRIAVFDDGVIQQLDSPQGLYERPMNAFVARFIGENNTLMGTVKKITKDKCDVTLETGEKIKALAVNVDGVGKKTLLSLRPERVVINPPKSAKTETVIRGRAEELIYLGDHIRMRLTVCGHDDFIVKVPNTEKVKIPSPGEELNLGWSANDCRALDTRTG